MNEQQLRALVREAILRYQEGAETGPDPGAVAASFRAHPSHGMFVLPTGLDADGPCVIEPAVMCSHCGYCKSYGH